HGRPRANHSAADNQHIISIRNTAPGCGMEANTQRLYQRQLPDFQKIISDYFLPGNREVFGHRTIPLDTQRLVELTGVWLTVQAGRAHITGCIRIDGNAHPRFQVRWNTFTHRFDDGPDLMPWYHRHFRQWVHPPERI